MIINLHTEELFNFQALELTLKTVLKQDNLIRLHGVIKFT